MTEKLKKVLEYLHDKNERELATIVIDVMNEQAAPLRPLRELADDKEMCEEIARLLIPKELEPKVFSITQPLKGETHIMIEFAVSNYELEDRIGETLIVFDCGTLYHRDEEPITNIISICSLISTKYKIDAGIPHACDFLTKKEKV